VNIAEVLKLQETSPVALSIFGPEDSPESGGRPLMQAKVIRSSRLVNASHFQEIIETLSSSLYRIKGFIRLDSGLVKAVQSCFGELYIKDMETYDGPSELILMGPDLESKSSLYRSIFN
jgi:hypothetical protein